MSSNGILGRTTLKNLAISLIFSFGMKANTTVKTITQTKTYNTYLYYLVIFTLIYFQ